MRHAIVPLAMSHINLVLEDYEPSIAHFQSLFDAELMADYPQKEWHAALLSIGRVIIEPFVPYDFLLNARYGPHYLGIEYQADMAEVRAAIASHGLRIVRDIDVALHTHPADSFGVALEFYAGSFHDRHWPQLGGVIRPAAYWRDEHGLGLLGLKAISIAVQDLSAASAFFQSFLSAQPLYEASRPSLLAQAIGLGVANSCLELISPISEGPLSQHLRACGEGIRSTIFAVKDIEQARAYCAARSLPMVAGSAPGSFAIPAEANRGIVFEFME